MPGRARFAAVAVIAGAFACLAGVGYAAGFVHFTHSSATSAQYPPSKVTICHHTHSQHNPFVTITVSEHALPAHLGHGDTVGACSAPQEQQGSTETQVTEAPQHGPSAHQDNGRHNGKAHPGKPSKPGKSGGDNGHGKGHGQGHGPNAVHGKGHGKGSGHGKGQNHGQGHGNGRGQGHGQGHGPGGGHGNSGGGKGNGHKP
jgi:hypothetical protein